MSVVLQVKVGFGKGGMITRLQCTVETNNFIYCFEKKELNTQVIFNIQYSKLQIHTKQKMKYYQGKVIGKMFWGQKINYNDN
ncbi:hypothetical protein AWJ07_01255 [Shewanella frigidimarina]|uniref:Uncharacterized protein n=1 Tax=Shewanella frigidimarina TaxID=56812 RepID=A0A106C2U8_SHEFR|nr:hypothetical protein AWJ07_01255 [Shewanella frigidimarina]